MRRTNKYLVSLLGIFVFFYIPNALYSQNIDFKCEDVIIWQQKTKLKWNDFQTNEYLSLMDTCGAESTFLLYGKYEIEDTLINFKVYNIFIKEDSWKTGCFNKGLLRHEQIHFDIYEYYTRLIRYYLTKSNKTRKTEIKIIFDLCVGMCENTNRQFDLETNYGEYGKIQKKWIKKMKSKNKKLRKYYEEISDQDLDSICNIINNNLFTTN